ncbi:MAG TPA: hypothetical protein VM431_04120 [Phycisphaerae bacterium]|nr:hypothetical protein [Phycisphaerae bacterium]
MASKWGSPEIVGEKDLRGNMTPASLSALARLSARQAGESAESDTQYDRDMARNRRIDYWGDRGTSSWQEPDYEGDALAERSRTQAGIGLDTLRLRGQIEGEQAAEFEPGAFRREAEGEDYAAELAAKRYWDPSTQSMEDQEWRRKMELVTAPPTIAGGSRETVAQTNAAGRMALEQLGLPPELMQGLAALTRSGAFGTDPGTGDVRPPGSPDAGAAQGPVQQGALDAFMRLISGAGQGDTTYSPQIEQQIQDAMEQTGQPRMAVVEHFKRTNPPIIR